MKSLGVYGLGCRVSGFQRISYSDDLKASQLAEKEVSAFLTMALAQPSKAKSLLKISDCLACTGTAAQG